MAYRLGVVPAAGNASRFNGIYKELLPIGQETLLEACVGTLAKRCDDVLLITSQEKIGIHGQVLGSRVKYAIQSGFNDIYSAMEESFKVFADRYYFQMPDCVVDPNWVLHPFTRPFGMGLFETMEPGRFGVLSAEDGRVVNKDPDQPVPARAWGTLTWDYEVVHTWRGWPELRNYTRAINMALDIYGEDGNVDYVDLDHYYDMATYDDYVKFIRNSGWRL